MTLVFKANGRCATVTQEPPAQPITAGSVGILAAFELSSDYNGLVVTAVFRAGGVMLDVLLTADLEPVPIPWEVLAAPALSLDIGVVGATGDGTIVIPTVWAKAGRIVPGAEASGISPEDPTADIGAQIVEQARAAAASAEASAESAGNAKEAAETAQDKAEDAQQAAEDAQQAAEDAASHYPQIINGTWWVWDVSAGGYVDTGVPASGGGGGTSDYDQLSNRPQINSHTLTGNQTAAQLGLVAARQGYDLISDADAARIGQNAEDIDAIEALLPAAASGSNKLADKAYVDDQVSTNTAHFRGNWATWASVPTNAADYPADDAGSTTPTSNDYMVVRDASGYPVASGDPALDGTWRFKYSGRWAINGKNGWEPEYQVNETPLTAAQLAALNSGATAQNIESIADKLDKAGDGSNVTVAFSAASSRANISTGEKLSVIMGKISKWLGDLGTAAFRAATNAITQGSTDLIESGAVHTALADKQAKVTDSGILKGNGSGGVSAATPGTDYVSPEDYNPDAKTSAMTQAVGKDASGKLWTAPGGGGGIPETWAGTTLLASGTIPAETAANTRTDTGVSYATFSRYRRVIFLRKCATNTSQGNITNGFGSDNNMGLRNGSAHLGVIFEHIAGYLYKAEQFGTNTAVYMPIQESIESMTGTPFQNTAIPFGYISFGVTYYDIRNGLAEFSDATTFRIYNWSATTAGINWYLWGLE